jgi:hypothetical protein
VFIQGFFFIPVAVGTFWEGGSLWGPGIVLGSVLSVWLLAALGINVSRLWALGAAGASRRGLIAHLLVVGALAAGAATWVTAAYNDVNSSNEAAHLPSAVGQGCLSLIVLGLTVRAAARARNLPLGVSA